MHSVWEVSKEKREIPMKEENGKEGRNAIDKYGLAENNMQYPYGVDKLKVGIEEINTAMLPEGMLGLLKRDRVLNLCRKYFTK